MIPYVLNLCDLALTLYALAHGGVELNPLMRCVPVMVAYKVIVIGALCLWLSKRTERIAKYGRWVITAVYAGLNIWHLINIL